MNNVSPIRRLLHLPAPITDSNLAQDSNKSTYTRNSSIYSSPEAIVHIATNKSLCAFQPHTASILTPLRPFQLGGRNLHAGFLSHRLLSTTADKHKQQRNRAVRAVQVLQLITLGFTEQQANRVLSFFVHRGVRLTLDNVQAWLQLLLQYHVDHPIEAVSRHPIILTSRATTAAANAGGVVEWFRSVGATPEMHAILLGKYPTLLTVPHGTASAVTTCLRSRMDWSDSTILNVLKSFPKVFAVAPTNLNVRLEWLLLNGISIDTISKVAKAQPQLLLRDFSSSINSTKTHYFTTIMGRTLLECLPFVTYSLLNNIGPRSAFHSVYCKDQPFKLNHRLRCSEATFPKHLVSPSLKAECTSCSQTRAQLFGGFKTDWQQTEGKKWHAGPRKKLGHNRKVVIQNMALTD